MDLHLELLGGFQAAEVRTGGNSLLQRLEKNSLKVQHLWQTAEQRLHLTEWQRDTLRSESQPQPSLHNRHLLSARFYLVFTEERLLLQGGEVDFEQTDEILKQNQKNVLILIKV